MELAYTVRPYNKEKSLVRCFMCDKEQKVRNKLLENFECCESDKWEFRTEFLDYKRRILKEGMKFELNKYEFTHLLTSKCFYCRRSPELLKSNKVRNGIDRIDNTKGYEKSNVVTCCFECNRDKRDISVEHFLDMAKKRAEAHKDLQNKTGIDRQLDMLSRGFTDFDLDILLLLYGKDQKVLPDPEKTFKNYIDSISKIETLKDKLKVLTKNIGMGVRLDGLNNKDAKDLLFMVVKIYMELIKEGKLKIHDKESFAKYDVTKAKMLTPMVCKIYRNNISNPLFVDTSLTLN